MPILWSRRHFVRMAGSTPLLAAIGGWPASPVFPSDSPRFAYIGGEQGIEVYSIAAGGSFSKQQTIASAYPVAMAISGRTLYVANGISDYGGLPCGSVEAYFISPATGQLQLKNRVPLSLSGTLPRDLAVSPDGRSVVVAVHGGGAYNVLPIHEDGRLGRVSGILKETGSGPHASQAAAHPSALLFDRVGRVLAADQGTDKLSVLSLRSGEFTVDGRSDIAAGCGPSSLAMDPAGKQLYVANALDGSVSSFDYDATDGRILDCRQTVRVSAASEMAALAMLPSGEMLYSSHGNGIHAWKIAANGAMQSLPEVIGVSARKLHVPPDGKSLLAVTGDAVLRMKIDAVTRVLGVPIKVASLPTPLSITTL
jgi:6-phosphogluconolactonase